MAKTFSLRLIINFKLEVVAVDLIWRPYLFWQKKLLITLFYHLHVHYYTPLHTYLHTY